MFLEMKGFVTSNNLLPFVDVTNFMTLYFLRASDLRVSLLKFCI